MRATEQAAHAEERERQQALYGWLSTAGAADIAGDVDEDTVRGWIASGKLKAFNAGTQARPRYRIRQDWLDAFMEGRTLNADAA